MCVFVPTSVYDCERACLRLCVCVYVDVCGCEYVCMCVRTRVCVGAFVRLRVRVRGCLCVSECSHVCVFFGVFVCA